MKFRSLDALGDWNFGGGLQSYATDLQAVILDLRTRLLSWVGDCFWDQGAGVDWKNLLDYGQRSRLESAVKAVAFQTAGVLRVYDITIEVDTDRTASVEFSVDTIFGTAVSQSLLLTLGGTA